MSDGPEIYGSFLEDSDHGFIAGAIAFAIAAISVAAIFFHFT